MSTRGHSTLQMEERSVHKHHYIYLNKVLKLTASPQSILTERFVEPLQQTHINPASRQPLQSMNIE